jgi:hypothetical protein
MYTTTTVANGKFFGLVRTEDERTLHTTPGYYTEGMALSAAKCWVAFHGGETMVDLNETYSAMRHAGAGFEWYHPTAQEVSDRVADAQKFSLVVEIRKGAQGQRYILISDGKGSGYGQYHIGAEFAAYVDEKRWNK